MKVHPHQKPAEDVDGWDGVKSYPTIDTPTYFFGCVYVGKMQTGMKKK